MKNFLFCLCNRHKGYGKAEISALNFYDLLPTCDYNPYADAGGRGHYHNTMFHEVLKYECVPCLKNLLSMHFKRQVGNKCFFEMLNARNRHHETPLLYGLRCGVNPAILEFLISEYCNITAADSNGETALHKVCKRGSIRMVAMLLEKGADVDAEDAKGRTPLYEAVCEERQDVVALLLAHNAKVKGSFDSDPFMTAILLKNSSLVRLLIYHVANINKEYSHEYFIPGYHGDFGGECFSTALQIAALRSNGEICQEIINHGGDVNYTGWTGNKSCLYRALEAPDNDAFKVIWKNIDQKQVLEFEGDILAYFLRYSTFRKKQMVEALEIIFTSPYINDIIEHHLLNLTRDSLEPTAVDFRMIRPYQLLFDRVLSEDNNKQNLTCINLFLTCCIPIYYGEIAYLYKWFGYGQELDAILRSGVEVRYFPINEAWMIDVHEFVNHFLYNEQSKKGASASTLLHLARIEVKSAVYCSLLKGGSCNPLTRISYLEGEVPTTMMDLLL